MSRVLLKTSLLLGIPTLIGMLLGFFLNTLLLSAVIGFAIGILILLQVTFVKMRHFANSIRAQYRRQPDNH